MVSGSAAATRPLLKCLGPAGSLVTYNGPTAAADSYAYAGVDVPVSAAIFNFTSVYGFDFCAWCRADVSWVHVYAHRNMSTHRTYFNN